MCTGVAHIKRELLVDSSSKVANLSVSWIFDTSACQCLGRCMCNCVPPCAFGMIMQIFCMCRNRRGLGHDKCSLGGLGTCEHVVKRSLHSL